MTEDDRKIEIAFIGGGSQSWAPGIIRDIIFKEGMERASVNFRLFDTDMPRAMAIKNLFDVKLKEWDVSHISINVMTDAQESLVGADFVIIAISTGRLEAMRHDLEIPEKYGVFHTVGDTVGPGGWSRALRNIPVFRSYAKLIKELAPDAYVLNYTNPMAPLTKVLADELGARRVIGLCHGFFETQYVLRKIFGLDSDNDIRIRFGGVNHFFWIYDFQVKGQDGYKLLRQKLNGQTMVSLAGGSFMDPMGWDVDTWLCGELFDNYGYMPYVGDRHICEFFGSYITDAKMLERFKLERTSIEVREERYAAAEERIRKWTAGEETDSPLNPEPSRETAADIIKAIAFNEPFTDVANLVNIGQIPNLPMGAVVETMGHVSPYGFVPLTVGPLPDSIRTLILPHAEVQLRLVKSAIEGDDDEALMALVADPVCARMAVSDVKQMGRELMDANKEFMEVAG